MPEKYKRYDAGTFLQLTLENVSASDYWPESRTFSMASAYDKKNGLIKLIIRKSGVYTTRIFDELQEGEEFVEAYLAAFPGLAKSFDQAKKLAVERGWVEVCGYTKKKYFFPDFEEMKELYDKAWSFFPKNYKDLNPQKKKEFRTELYAKKPEVKTLFILAGKLKGKLR